jgi:hypothetical protein
MRIVTTTYQDEFLKLGRLLDSQFKSDPEKFKNMVANTGITEKIGASVYAVLVSRKMCKEIGQLDQVAKLELWNEAQAWCPGAGKEKLLNVCKLIWAIEHL